MKRLLILGLCVAALGVVGVSFSSWRERENSLRRATIAAKEQKRRRFEDDVLSRPILLDGERMTLEEFAEEIGRQVGTTVVVTEAAKLQYGESVSHWLIELPRGRYSLRSLLAWLEVEQPEFYVEFDEDTITVATAEWPTISNRLQTVVYPLPQPEPAGMSEEDWLDLIQEAAIGWRGNVPGNLFGEIVVESVPGGVVVVHDAAGQRKVRWMMERLTAFGEHETGGLLWPLQGADSQRERIRAALDEKSSCRFEDTPLEQAMEQLAAQHGIPIHLRKQKLDEASVPVTFPITKSVKGISLRSLLTLILKDVELSYLVEDQGLVITTPENAENHEIIMAYPVGDLVEKFGDSHDAVDWDSLVSVIVASVRPDSWDFSGPTPGYGYGDRWLIFQQTEAVHQDVGGLMDQMRWVMAGKPGAVPPSLRAAQESEVRIRAALNRTIELDNKPRSLKEAASLLQEALGIPILVTEKRLEEAGVSLDVLVASDLGTATAGDHLAAMLRAQTLTTVIRDEVLQITTPEDEESQSVTRVYDTRHLLRKAMSAERLCDLITAKIQPGKWDDNGGPGNVESYADLLVVNQTQAIQQEVERYLEKLGNSLDVENTNDGK
jgi:hypothetical protein